MVICAHQKCIPDPETELPPGMSSCPSQQQSPSGASSGSHVSQRQCHIQKTSGGRRQAWRDCPRPWLEVAPGSILTWWVHTPSPTVTFLNYTSSPHALSLGFREAFVKHPRCHAAAARRGAAMGLKLSCLKGTMWAQGRQMSKTLAALQTLKALKCVAAAAAAMTRPPS
ncbi:uncharacterized protein C16orf74 homolog isoform X2 [Ailuropoda melanoleuca]|uniref:uncharacterized protein C16orf74 homolog isoform X2 n=1 Tax=Ailuropoda melanoleuca TaxID=9646 RepID=UPI001493FEE4|nr:uncharacterized protein C16orf74 homolog isoform X2 [Ailuropoda melanoleuca]